MEDLPDLTPPVPAPLPIRNPKSTIRNLGLRPPIGFVLRILPLRRLCPRPDRRLPRHGVPLRTRPARHLFQSAIRNPQSAIWAPGPRLGLFCAFRLFVEPAPDLIGGCLGVQCRSAPSPPDIFPAARNWVCSAHLPSGRAKLGSFGAFDLRHLPASGLFQSAIRNPKSAILGPRPRNWVRFARLTPRPSYGHTATAFAHMPQSPQVWLRFARFPPAVGPGAGEIGFVLRTWPPVTACGGAELGSFGADVIPAGRLQSAIRNHQSAIAGPPAPLARPFKLEPVLRGAHSIPIIFMGWCHWLFLTVSDRRHRRRAHFYI
jgi:hypothetical protein